MSQNHPSSMLGQHMTISSHCNDQILRQLNSNTLNSFPLAFRSNAKRQSYLNKKALYVKLQKAQLEHCCIDIVNRKNKSLLIDRKNKDIERSTNISHIQMLKKEIQYLQEDNLKWQKFPKSQFDLGASQSICSTSKKKSLALNLQSLQKLSLNTQSNSLIKKFYNTFNNNFFISPLPLKGLKASQKKAKAYFCSTDKKKLLKNQITIDSTTSKNKENLFSKTIHSTSNFQSTNYRKYFLMNRARKNSACTQNQSELMEVRRKRISNSNSFVLQTV